MGEYQCRRVWDSSIANKKSMEYVSEYELNQFWTNEVQSNVETKIYYDD